MTTYEIAAIKARAEKATKGPWIVDDDKGGGTVSHQILTEEGQDIIAAVDSPQNAAGDSNPFDAQFIAHARVDIPTLLVEIERLRGLVEGPAGRKTPDFYDVTIIGGSQEDVVNTGRQLQRRFPEIQFLVHDDKCVVRPGDLDTVEAERAACLEILEDRGCSYNGCSVEHGHDSLCPLAIARDIRARGGE